MRHCGEHERTCHRVNAPIVRRTGVGAAPGCGGRTRGFVVRFSRVEIHPPALKHGMLTEDIEHVVRNAVVSDELAIHAMAMGEKYRRLLPGG